MTELNDYFIPNFKNGKNLNNERKFKKKRKKK